MMVFACLFLLSAIVQAAPDGLSQGSVEDSDAKMKLWDACLNKAIKNPAELTNDPSDVVVEIALINCETEFSNARFAWRRMLIAKSSLRPTDVEAEKMAEESFSKFEASRRRSLLPKVSFLRQMQTLDKIKADLRK